MGNHSPLLSLCIPTNGIVEWVIPTIDSIYSQGVDHSLFEVVVTDNGGKPDLEEAVRKYAHDNFHYYRTNAQGFTNQIDAFEKCSGLFCKMLNHRSRMLPESVNSLIRLVLKYQDTKPILYCAEGVVKGDEFIECANTDEFVRHLSYWISWSSGTGAWREDIEDVRSKAIDEYFPHTVFLLGLRKESSYVIWNGKYEMMANDDGKGGYDVFNVFGVHLLDILSDLKYQNRISEKTFRKVKVDLFKFLITLYQKEVILPSKHTFIIRDVRRHIQVYYGDCYYWCMVIGSYLLCTFSIVKRMLNKMSFRNIVSTFASLLLCRS